MSSLFLGTYDLLPYSVLCYEKIVLAFMYCLVHKKLTFLVYKLNTTGYISPNTAVLRATMQHSSPHSICSIMGK